LQSPLLSLPAEIRNKIFRYALGHQHVHILTDDYVDESGSSSAADLPGPVRFVAGNSGMSELNIKVQTRKFYNCAFPLDWSFYRRTEPWSAPPYLPNGSVWSYEGYRLIKSTSHCIGLFQATCRQIYHETGLLSYELNEFSFQEEVTMKNWFGNRLVAQKRAINTVWFDIEWSRRSPELINIPPFPSGHADARHHIGKDHGIKNVYVSTSAYASLYGTTGLGWGTTQTESHQKRRFKETVHRLLRRNNKNLRIEFAD
jgi:hypothetical protein